MSDPSNSWSHLKHLQVGKYAEYFVKMAFTKAGLDVYTAEVDDKGIDFVIRRDASTYFDVQVKSIRGLNYVYMNKDKFKLADNMWAALVIFLGEEPDLFLIPAEAWNEPNSLLVDRDYEGLKSEPDWGINLSKKNLPRLEPYRFGLQIEKLTGQ